VLKRTERFVGPGGISNPITKKKLSGETIFEKLIEGAKRSRKVHLTMRRNYDRGGERERSLVFYGHFYKSSLKFTLRIVAPRG